MGTLSRKINGLNQVLLNPKHKKETKIDAEWKLLVISELLRDHPALDYADELHAFVRKVADGDFYTDGLEAQALLERIKDGKN